MSDIDYIVPTHIHLDHFGGGGHIMELCKNAKALVHPKAYKHVSNIEKWWQTKKVQSAVNLFCKNICNLKPV